MIKNLAVTVGIVGLSIIVNQHQLEAHEPAISLKADAPYFTFDGQDRQLSLGNSPVVQVSKGDFTVEAKVLFRSLDGNDGPCLGPGCDMSIADKMSDKCVVNCDGWRLIKQSSNLIYFCLGRQDKEDGCAIFSNTRVVGKTKIQINTWHHIFATKKGNDIAIYINGIREDAKNASGYKDTNQTGLLVGASRLEGAHLNGAIDLVKLYGAALSQSEIMYRSTH